MRPGTTASWAALLLAGCASMGTPTRAGGAFRDGFDRRRAIGREWEVTSGTLELRDGKAETASPVFRAVTRRRDFRDAEVSFTLLNRGLGESGGTPATDWDGVHVFLRYQSQYHLYYASVNRRDHTAVIKKKVPGGPSNGGTYYDLSPRRSYPVPYGRPQRVRATVRDVGGAVVIEAYVDGRLVARARDDGRVGGPPIREPGRVGVRADNADISLDDFAAGPLPPHHPRAARR